MQILPNFLTETIAEHGEIIAEYYSNELYATLLRKHRSHLLVKLAKKLDLNEMEKACASYHHQNRCDSIEADFHFLFSFLNSVNHES